MSLPGKLPRTPILCYVTDRKSLVYPVTGDHRGELLKCIAAAASAGVDWIQIREKDLSGEDISLLVRESLALVKQSNQESGRATLLLVNDRLDVAVAERADGVHLGERSLPIGKVSQWIASQPRRSGHQNFVVGVSCHSLEGALAAARDGADYIFFGPIFFTPSKAAFGSPQGLPRLKEVCSSVSVPVLAIGGITLENASSCLDAGAAGIAAIRLFQDPIDLGTLTVDLRSHL